MPKVNDRVVETTTTTGTGAVTLAGAVAGYQAFSAAFLDQDIVFYCIEAVTGNSPTGDWEVGTGTFTLSGTTLSRTNILGSSNGGAVVNLSAGTKKVFCPISALLARQTINPNLFDTMMGGL